MRKSEIGEGLREVAGLLEEMADNLDALTAVSGENAKEVINLAKRYSSGDKIVLKQEDYENLAVVMNKFKQALKIAPEPIKSTMEFSYYLGFINGMLKSKGIVV
jgi:hypothetical protein